MLTSEIAAASDHSGNFDHMTGTYFSAFLLAGEIQVPLKGDIGHMLSC